MENFLIETNNNLPFYKRKLFFIICGSIFVLLLIIIIVVATKKSSKKDTNTQSTKFTPYICLDENNSPSKKCVGGWFYKTQNYTPEYNAKFVKKKNWNYVLLSANINRKNMTEIIREFLKQKISVHFMTLQDTKYLDEPESVYDKIKDIILFLNNNNLDIQGIHIDVEPHAKTEWKNADSEVRTKIFQNYTRILEICRKAINDFRPNLTFSAAVSWFYPSKTKKNEIEGGRGYELVNEKRLDFVFPMVYSGAGGSFENIIKHSEDYLEDKANTVIGIAVEDFNENLDDMINQVIEYRKNSNYFYGISIYANHYYSDWGEPL